MIIEVNTFRSDCTDREQALKVLEEAAEVFAAYEDCGYGLSMEIADVITAACNLAERFNIDMVEAMRDCEEKNRKRGRYGQDCK